MIRFTKKINRFFKRHLPFEQNTHIMCSCGNELIGSGSFVSDTYNKKGENHVIYGCINCGRIHDYTFDVAPVPVSWMEVIV